VPFLLCLIALHPPSSEISSSYFPSASTACPIHDLLSLTGSAWIPIGLVAEQEMPSSGRFLSLAPIRSAPSFAWRAFDCPPGKLRPLPPYQEGLPSPFWETFPFPVLHSSSHIAAFCPVDLCVEDVFFSPSSLVACECPPLSRRLISFPFPSRARLRCFMNSTDRFLVFALRKSVPPLTPSAYLKILPLFSFVRLHRPAIDFFYMVSPDRISRR